MLARSLFNIILEVVESAKKQCSVIEEVSVFVSRKLMAKHYF